MQTLVLVSALVRLSPSTSRRLMQLLYGLSVIFRKNDLPSDLLLPKQRPSTPKKSARNQSVIMNDPNPGFTRLDGSITVRPNS